MVRAAVVACALFLLVAHAQDLSKSRRVALVIGNSAYTLLPKLPSVPKDVEAISAALKKAGFEVYQVNDFKLPEFFQGAFDLGNHLKAGDVCVLYYAGYVVQGEDDNYLLPVNFDPNQGVTQDLAYHLIKLEEYLSAHGVALKILMLEGPPAINIPVKGMAGIGLVDPQIGAKEETKETVFISAGRLGDWVPVASGGGIDVLTRVAAKAIDEQKIELDQLFAQVKREVTASSGQQNPFRESSVGLAQFYFHEPEKTADAPPIIKTPPPPEWPRQGVIVSNLRDREEYVWIKPQTFMMGCVPGGEKPCSDAEKARHQVTLTKGFWMGRNEVQVDSYKRYVAQNKPAVKMPKGPLYDSHWRFDDHPMVDVRWEEAQAYCVWAGGRLPTEAEWEFAARGGMKDEIYPMNSENSRDSANFAGKSGNDIYEDVAPVRKFNPNSYGLFDMAGNVWEWVNDWFAPYAAAPVTDPKGPNGGKEHAIRGGSFDSDPKVHLRISYRKGMSKDQPNVGFRCVIDDTPESRKQLPQPAQ
jgi:sulfatase modifying factor 1